jgi:hypothetical protein
MLWKKRWVIHIRSLRLADLDGRGVDGALLYVSTFSVKGQMIFNRGYDEAAI